METVELRQGTGENQIRLSVNIDKETKDMMEKIRYENLSKWIDRDLDLYKEACARLKRNTTEVQDRREIKFSNDVGDNNAGKNKTGRIILYVVIGIVFAGLLVLLLEHFMVIPIALFVGAFCLNAMFGKGK